MPEKVIENIDDYSYASYYTEVFYNDIKLSSATAFVYSYRNQLFLITNLHVVTGKDIFTNECLNVNAAIPNKLKVYMFKKVSEVSLEYTDVEIPLNFDNPNWYTVTIEDRKIDIAVIKLNLEEDIICYPINELEEPCNEETEIHVRDDVFVIGYPFGFREVEGLGLPIWKRGSIASEPSANMRNITALYIDTATRSGMSGSPVVYKERRTVTIVSSDNKFSRYYTKFIGVYSGRIGKKGDLQLGIVWKGKLIEDIIKTIPNQEGL